MKKKLFVLILVSLMVAIGFSGCFGEEGEDEPEGITAKEAIEIANPTATEWNMDAQPIFVQGHTGDKGRFRSWAIRYSYISNGSEMFDPSILIYIEDGKLGSTHEGYNTQQFILFDNFNLDSTDAYDTAVSNEVISKYLEEYNAPWEYFVLWSEEDALFWQLTWKLTIGEGSYRAARIHIDAMNGDILEVEAD